MATNDYLDWSFIPVAAYFTEIPNLPLTNEANVVTTAMNKSKIQ